jgi:hypothetical protein
MMSECGLVEYGALFWGFNVPALSSLVTPLLILLVITLKGTTQSNHQQHKRHAILKSTTRIRKSSSNGVTVDRLILEPIAKVTVTDALHYYEMVCNVFIDAMLFFAKYLPDVTCSRLQPFPRCGHIPLASSPSDVWPLFFFWHFLTTLLCLDYVALLSSCLPAFRFHLACLACLALCYLSCLPFLPCCLA